MSDRTTSPNHRMSPRRVLRLVYKTPPKLVAPQATSPKQVAIDDFLDSIIRDFDLSPIMFGNKAFSKLVALDLISEVETRTIDRQDLSGEEFTLEDVMARFQDRLENQRASMLAFERHLYSLIRRGSV